MRGQYENYTLPGKGAERMDFRRLFHVKRYLDGLSFYNKTYDCSEKVCYVWNIQFALTVIDSPTKFKKEGFYFDPYVLCSK